MLDVVLIGIVALSAIWARRNGITKELIRIASFIVGLVVAMWGHGPLALELEPWIANPTVAAILAFIALLLVTLLVGTLIGNVLAGMWSGVGLGWLDRSLGVGFGVIRGVLISAVLLLGLVAFQPLADTSRIVATSRIAPWIMNVARTAVSLSPRELREAFTRGLSRIEEERAADRA